MNFIIERSACWYDRNINFRFCKQQQRQQQQQQKPELKFIYVNFFEIFRAKFSYRRILTGTFDNKAKHCLCFPVVLTTYVTVS